MNTPIDTQNTSAFFDATHPLLLAINAPEHGGGLLPAVVTVHRAIKAAYRLLPSPRAALIVQEANRLVKQIEGRRRDYPAVTAPDGRDITRPTYGAIVQPASCYISAQQLERVDAILGIALCAAMSTQGSVKVDFLEAWQTLRRSFAGKGVRHKDWEVLAAELPVLSDELESTLAKITYGTVKHMLTELLRMHGVLLAPALDRGLDITPQARPEDSPSNAAQKIGLAFDEPQTQQEEDSEKSLEPTANEVLISYQVTKALFARFPEKMGLCDADVLPPPELRTVCQGIAVAICGDSEQNRIFASLAICSLVSRLSPRLALALPLYPNGDQHIDLLQGVLISSYARLTQSTSVERIPGPSEGDIFTPFPKIIAAVWVQLNTVHPNATNCAELHGVPVDAKLRTAWLAAYGLFLRSLGNEVFPAYSVRFAHSLSQVYLQVSQQDGVAAFLGLGIAGAAPGMLHYLYLDRDQVERHSSQVYEYLGLGKPFALPSSFSGCGSSKAVSPQVLTAGWEQMMAHIGRTRKKLVATSDEDEYLALFNELSSHLLTAVVILLAHRAQRLDRLTFGALYFHAELIHLVDKGTVNGVHSRLVPKVALVAELLQGFLMDLTLFAKAAKKGKWICREIAERSLPPLRYNALAFRRYNKAPDKPGTYKVVRKPFEWSDITEVTQHYFQQPANFGRHFWTTALCARNTNRWHIRQLTGHTRQDAEVFHEYGLISPEIATKGLRLEMENVVADLELTPPPRTASLEFMRSQPDFALWLLPEERQFHDPNFPKIGRNYQTKVFELFHGRTLSSISLIDALRYRLAHSQCPGSSESALLLHLVVFEGYCTYSDLRQVFSKEGNALLQIDGQPVVSIRRESGQEITTPLSPITKILLKRTNLDIRSLDFDSALQAACRWLRNNMTTVNWPSTEKHCLAGLLSCLKDWQNYYLPPALVTAYAQDTPATTLSKHSILRISRPEAPPTDIHFPPWRPESLNSKYSSNQSVADLQQCLNKWADTSRQLGGNGERARHLRNATGQLARAPSGSPGDYLSRWLNREVEKILKQDQNALKLSSLATYFSNFKPAFEQLSACDSLDEYLADDWESLFRLATRMPRASHADEGAKEATKAKEAAQARRNDLTAAIKRLFQTMAETGAAIPPHLYAAKGAESTYPENAASAVYINTSDLQWAKCRAQEILMDWPTEAMRAGLKLKLIPAALMRYGECRTLPIQSCLPDSGLLVVEEHGFSNLKSRAARRLPAVGTDIREDLEQLGREIRKANPKAEFLFLDSAEGIDREQDAGLRLLVTQLLQIATGNSTARIHSLRGYGINQRLYPDWDQVAQAMFFGLAGPVKCALLFEQRPDSWTRFAQTAIDAGHAGRFTTATYYWSSWPLLRAAALCATLTRLRRPPSMEKDIGLKDGAFRQARARHLARSIQTFDAWAWAGSHCLFPHWKPLEVEGVALARTGEEPRREAGCNQENFAAAAKYLASRLLNVPADVAQTRNRLASSHVVELERRVPDPKHSLALRRRVKGTAFGRALEADVRELEKPDAGILLDDRARGPLANDDLLLQVLCGEDLEDLSLWNDPEECPNIFGKCLSSLPSQFALEVSFGIRHQNPAIAADLATNSRLVVAAPQRDISKTPKVHVVYADAAQRTAVSKARLTTLVRILLTAFQNLPIQHHGELQHGK